MASLPRILGMGSTIAPSVGSGSRGPVAVIEWTVPRPLRLLGLLLEGQKADTEVFLVGFLVDKNALWLGSGVSVAETRRAGRFDLWPETGGRLSEPGSVVRLEIENRSSWGQTVNAYVVVDLDPHGLESMGPVTDDTATRRHRWRLPTPFRDAPIRSRRDARVDTLSDWYDRLLTLWEEEDTCRAVRDETRESVLAAFERMSGSPPGRLIASHDGGDFIVSLYSDGWWIGRGPGQDEVGVVVAVDRAVGA